MRLRIVHKGLIFMLVPVMLQVCCILQLYSLVQKSEQLAEREAHTARIVELYNEIMNEFAMSWATVVSFSERYERTPQFQTKLQGLFDELIPLLDGDYKRKMTEFAKTTLAAQNDLLNDYDSTVDKASLIGRIGLLSKLTANVRRISSTGAIFKDDIESQRTQLEAMRRQEHETRGHLKSQIMAAIVAEICLTLLVVALFLRNITSRLGILVANSRKLPAHVPITDRVAGTDELADLDEVLHQASEELRQAAEYRASLMQMVAHDLRTPLGSAALALDGIATAPALPEKERQRAQGVKGTLAQLTRFVEDLLTIDKLEAGKLEIVEEAIDVRAIASSVCTSLEPLAAKKNVTLKCETPSIGLAADPDRLVQVFANLIGNAIKFSPTGGTVLVRAAEQTGSVRIEVCDEGPGISESSRSGLFQKFHQTRPGDSAGGFGLGLAICKLIVDAHGGAIGVSSRLPHGSTFWFTLPLLED